MGYKATVIGGSLNLRSEPDTSSTRLDSIPNGTELSVIAYEAPIAWRLTYYDQKLGYVMAQYLNISNDPDYQVDACMYFGPVNLSEGSQGDYVWTLQNFLNLYDHADITQDGDFGPATKNAVIHYQQTRSLEADGVVGPATKLKMWMEKEFG